MSKTGRTPNGFAWIKKLDRKTKEYLLWFNKNGRAQALADSNCDPGYRQFFVAECDRAIAFLEKELEAKQ